MQPLPTPEGRLADQPAVHPITLTGHTPGRRPALLSTRLTRANLLASLTTLALAGCGGGGTDKSDTPADNTAALLLSSVAAPSYTGQALRAFEVLNAERARCGFGLLAQNSRIDTAADGHSVWMLKNSLQAHDQIPGTVAFTGTTIADRLRVAGYPSARTWGEVISPIDDWTKNAEAGVRLLFNAPYHAVGLLRGYREVGIGFRTSRDVDLPTDYLYGKLTINLATSTADVGQTAGNNVVRTYPCEGSSGVLHLLWGESPSPVPDRDLFAHPIGTTVLIAGDINKKLTITSANMTGPGGVAVALRPAVTESNDPNAAPGRAYLLSHEAFISANAPLATKTTYQVSITGTNGSMPFSRTFSFVTGGGAVKVAHPETGRAGNHHQARGPYQPVPPAAPTPVAPPVSPTSPVPHQLAASVQKSGLCRHRSGRRGEGTDRTDGGPDPPVLARFALTHDRHLLRPPGTNFIH